MDFLNCNGKVALAPMAGVADRAFRELCVNYGACYSVTEMVSAKGLSLNDKKSKELLAITDAERPCGAQIFGNDPKTMAIATEKALEFSKTVKNSQYKKNLEKLSKTLLQVPENAPTDFY